MEMREFLSMPHGLLEDRLIPNIRGIVAYARLLRGISISKYLLLNIMGLFLYVSLLAIYVALCMCRYFLQGNNKSLGEGFIKCLALSLFYKALISISW